MKKLLPIFIIVFLYSQSSVFASWVQLNDQKDGIQFRQQGENVSLLTVTVSGFNKEQITTSSATGYKINCINGSSFLIQGSPDVPKLTSALIIPDKDEVQVEVLNSTYVELSIDLLPSKGNLKRNINPADVPFTFNESYTKNEFYPGQLASLRTPYILRDFRGQTVVISPFQYNPVTKILRVYTSMQLRVSPTGRTSTQNNIQRISPLTQIDPTFAGIYQRHFINYRTSFYTALNEHGKMLVISDDALMTTMQPFVDWKNRMGQPTQMVALSAIGNTSTSIKSFISNLYTTSGLTYVLLVGDDQLTTYSSSYGDSDPSYGYISGNDTYAEVIVGRFSANDETELGTQVERTLTYEMNPDPVGSWYHKGVCIGSEQGPGDDNEMDFEHERNIRTDLINYFYTDVDELYDGNQNGMDRIGDPIASDLVNALNAGRSVINYTGHGSATTIGTTDFSTTDVQDLTNENQLPFMWSVACKNGLFVQETCLAEVLMRSTSNDRPTGTIANLMSTILQSWDPPMDGQDEMVDLLVESYPGNLKHTFGGISVNGCMHMNDVYGIDGDEITATWTAFGDPSLTVRTNTPHALTVTANGTIDPAATQFIVQCSGDQALACLSHHNQMIGAAWTLAGSAFLSVNGLSVGDTLDLTITAYNAIPYFSQVIVTPLSTGISNVNIIDHFQLYPNPATSTATLTFNHKVKGNISINIFTMTGEKLMTYSEVLNSQNSITLKDLSRFSTGLYICEVSGEGFVEYAKLLLK